MEIGSDKTGYYDLKSWINKNHPTKIYEFNRNAKTNESLNLEDCIKFFYDAFDEVKEVNGSGKLWNDPLHSKSIQEFNAEVAKKELKWIEEVNKKSKISEDFLKLITEKVILEKEFIRAAKIGDVPLSLI
ncbi:353_t:CDS:2 [Ambispora gerdemannii]|uniref:353_t:CDS:1 n=1 Tax=Ambispora gerdemannii TaxID=144530 RepID=A0A9N9EC21_9GLOM|nr:353_t:CDS:2 [Ambispora gerdemannii]